MTGRAGAAASRGPGRDKPRRRGFWQRRRDQGSIGAMVAVLAPPIIGLIGLVYDGGLALEGRQRALDAAEQAARAAANQCNLVVLRAESRCVITDSAAAANIAGQFMANGVTLEGFRTEDCVGTVAGQGCFTVVVQTRVVVETLFLGLFGVNQFDIVLAERRATAVTGLA